MGDGAGVGGIVLNPAGGEYQDKRKNEIEKEERRFFMVLMIFIRFNSG